jgi:non-ribosomal peptide synthetase component F
MLLDSEAKVLLTQSLLQEVYSGLSDRLAVLHLDAAMPPWRDRPLSNPEPLAICLTPHHLAYIIYTSGSTG